MELVELLSAGSSVEVGLVNQITESYKDHVASKMPDNHERLTLFYIDYKYEILDNPSFKQSAKTFDISVMPITCLNIISALIEHPLAGNLE